MGGVLVATVVAPRVRLAWASIHPAARRGVPAGFHALPLVELDRRVGGVARGPDERAGEVEDEAVTVLDEDGVEGGGRVLTDDRDQGHAIAC